MTESPDLFHLGPPLDQLGALADFLRAARGADVTIRTELDRPLATPEVQLLLAAIRDPAGPSAVRVAPASGRIASGLRLLGLDGCIEVAD
ncbi:hypothetical protein [Rubellimicrobium mesophilum]|nr:hypothetical protein [Rubellimicrobium mesophilum]